MSPCLLVKFLIWHIKFYQSSTKYHLFGVLPCQLQFCNPFVSKSRYLPTCQKYSHLLVGKLEVEEDVSLTSFDLSRWGGKELDEGLGFRDWYFSTLKVIWNYNSKSPSYNKPSKFKNSVRVCDKHIFVKKYHECNIKFVCIKDSPHLRWQKCWPPE